MPYIGPGGGGSAGGTISGVSVTGTAVAGDVPVASSAVAGTWAFPPGHEFGYDQITGNVNIVSLTEATGTTIITCAAHTFDGAAVICDFFSGQVVLPAETVATTAVSVTFSLFEGATQITRLAFALYEINQTVNNQMQIPIFGSLRFTPTAASHTYTVTAICSSTNGTPVVVAGAGGTGTPPPTYVRFTKV